MTKPDLRVHSDNCEHNDRWDSCNRASPSEIAAALDIDYEAAQEVYANQRPGVGPATDRKRVRAIVDAALGLDNAQS